MIKAAKRIPKKKLVELAEALLRVHCIYFGGYTIRVDNGDPEFPIVRFKRKWIRGVWIDVKLHIVDGNLLDAKAEIAL